LGGYTLMVAYYKKDKTTKRWHLLFLLDGQVASAGNYPTKKDAINYAKRDLGVTEVNDWNKRK